MDPERAGKPVLVGIANPDVAQQLVRTAGDLARLETGAVRLVTVAVKPHDSPFGVFDDETIVDEFADDSHELLDRVTTPPDVTVERDVLAARSAASGILAAVEETDPAALVVGWQGRVHRSDAVFGTTVDTLVERAPCDLYVERVGREANGVESILLPVAGGPHVGAAARIARAIAIRNDARVVVFSVAAGGVSREEADAFVAEGREELTETTDGELGVETVTAGSDDVTDAVVDEAAGHDVVVLGTTRQGAIRRKLAGSVPRRVVERTEQTVILARDGASVGGPLHRLGGLLRR